jgi:Ca-activated chloride channel family protein
MSGGSLLTWGAVGWLNLLWGLPVLALVLIQAQRLRRRDLERLAASSVLRRLVPADLGERRVWQSALLLCGVALLIVALAQPQLGFQWRDVERRGIDIALVVDVSRSMDAQDVSPSRMERARREILDLCEQAPGDRFGLVVFAAGAYPRVPLTLDHDALLTILREVDTGTLRAQGSSLPAAVREALRLLQDEESNDKAIVLISDGEIPDVERALAAARVAGEAEVSIYVMGVGTPEGAPIPLAGGGFKKDASGDVVITQLDESTLRRIAAAAGGAYVRSVASEDDVKALVDEIHDNHAEALLGVHREKVPNEHFQWPLGIGLALLALGLVLGLPRRSLAPAALVLLAVALCSSPARASALQDGLEAAAQGSWERAAELLMEHHLAHPDDMDGAMALGQALLLSGQPNQAERVWEQVAERSTDPKQRAMARYDMGHAAYRGGRLTQAHEHFRRAAEIDPALEAATKNAEAVAQEIAARTQDPEQQPDGNCDNPQQGDQGQQQDPQNQDQENQENQENQDQENQDQEDQDPQDRAQEDRQPEQGQPPEPDDGQRQEQPEPQEPMEGEIEPVGGEEQPQPAPDPQQPLEVDPAQIDRARALERLDEVEEGSPRVVVPGDASEDQDW